MNKLRITQVKRRFCDEFVDEFLLWEEGKYQTPICILNDYEAKELLSELKEALEQDNEISD